MEGGVVLLLLVLDAQEWVLTATVVASGIEEEEKERGVCLVERVVVDEDEGAGCLSGVVAVGEGKRGKGKKEGGTTERKRNKFRIT